MYKCFKNLVHPADFDNAMFFGLNVAVWRNGQLIDYGGQIEKHTDISVKINGGYFLKATHEFKVR